MARRFSGLARVSQAGAGTARGTEQQGAARQASLFMERPCSSMWSPRGLVQTSSQQSSLRHHAWQLGGQRRVPKRGERKLLAFCKLPVAVTQRPSPALSLWRLPQCLPTFRRSSVDMAHLMCRRFWRACKTECRCCHFWTTQFAIMDIMSPLPASLESLSLCLQSFQSTSVLCPQNT